MVYDPRVISNDEKARVVNMSTHLDQLRGSPFISETQDYQPAIFGESIAVDFQDLGIGTNVEKKIETAEKKLKDATFAFNKKKMEFRKVRNDMIKLSKIISEKNYEVRVFNHRRS